MRGVRVEHQEAGGSRALPPRSRSVSVRPSPRRLQRSSDVKPFGQQERLNVGVTGGPMIGYTVRDLGPSSDPVPHNGQLYAAALTVDAFGSRARSDDPYVQRPRGELGAIPSRRRGRRRRCGAAGRQHDRQALFRCRGRCANSVVYNDGVRDILAWVPGAPEGGTRPHRSAPSNRTDAHHCGFNRRRADFYTLL